MKPNYLLRLKRNLGGNITKQGVLRHLKELGDEIKRAKAALGPNPSKAARAKISALAKYFGFVSRVWDREPWLIPFDVPDVPAPYVFTPTPPSHSPRRRVRGTRAQVMHGTVQKTRAGTGASRFTYNKRGRIVSKKRHSAGEHNPWIKAVTKARKQLGITGFVPVRKGSRLYKLAKKLQR